MLATLKRHYYISKLALAMVRNYYYDFKRYLKYSATFSDDSTQEQWRGRIIAHYHVVEKGLSLREPRVGFGKKVIKSLISLVKDYQQKYGSDDLCQIAFNVLSAYYQFNLKNGLENPEMKQTLAEIKANLSDQDTPCGGGVIEVTKAQIQKDAMVDFKDFAYSRYSVRNFAESEVSLEAIEEAIAIAIKTPSVCNRQTWKTYAFSEPEAKQKILSYQNGNRGFGDTASKILIITSDLSRFKGVAERNQCFVDGGMFAMSVVYALHSLGLGSCCLNWSAPYERDSALKSAAGISGEESVIMMIAVGNLPDTFRVAESTRKHLTDTLIFC